MLFTNPTVIRNISQVKLACLEVDEPMISFHQLVGCMERRLEAEITRQVDDMVANGVDRGEALNELAEQAYQYLDFAEKRTIQEPADLAAAIVMDTNNFESFKIQLYSNFFEIHPDKIKKDTLVDVEGELPYSDAELREYYESYSWLSLLEILRSEYAG
jgi:hypothetical protein